MQKSFLLGISVGESFAEFALLSGDKAVALKRIYFSRDNLKTNLQQFLQENSASKPEKAFISLRLPKRLLDFRLSGPAAHLTTAGFEDWLNICGKSLPLTEQSLVFPVQERLSANGEVVTALDIEHLREVSVKIKEAHCSKVCIHFLHANKNPVHEEQAKNFFLEQGFEVFTPASTDDSEVLRWNKNSLNATVSGVLNERKEEIFAGLDGVVEKENIFLMNSEGHTTPHSSSHPIGDFFSASTAMALAYGAKNKSDILYLGLECFTFIYADEWNNTWQSPWGPVAAKHARMEELEIQPTACIGLNDFGHFDFENTVTGWEPGPMLLGRGQKPTLMDLWAENPKLQALESLQERVNATGVQRFKNALFAMSKISSMKDSDVPKLSKDLQSLSLQRLAMEAFLKRQTQKLLIMGPLASVFGNAFKKDKNAIVFTEEFHESMALALCGARDMEGK